MSKKKTAAKNPYTKKEQRGASPSGFHFYHLYQCCPRKFFIKYLARIEPTHTAAPLISGAAFHEAKAVFYSTHSLKKAVAKCEREIKSRKAEFYDSDRYEFDMLRYPLLLEKWIIKYGFDDLDNMNIHMLEEEISMPVPSTENFRMTMRADLVFSYKGDKDIYVMDTKTSSHSIGLTQDTLYYGDQATTYIYGVSEKMKRPVRGLIADIAYWHKNSTSPDKIQCVRGDLIVRTPKQLKEFMLNVSAVFNEISQKVNAFASGKYSEHLLFPRCTYYCMSYNKRCEYSDICRTQLSLKGRTPNGFRRTAKSKKASFSAYTNDIEVIS